MKGISFSSKLSADSQARMPGTSLRTGRGGLKQLQVVMASTDLIKEIK